MNQPWIYIYMFPILNPPPTSLSTPSSGSSQCTSPEHLSHASNLGWWSVSRSQKKSNSASGPSGVYTAEWTSSTGEGSRAGSVLAGRVRFQWLERATGVLHEDVKGEREFSQQWDMGSREQFRTDSPGAPRWKEGGVGSRGRARESGVPSEATAAWRGLHSVGKRRRQG